MLSKIRTFLLLAIMLFPLGLMAQQHKFTISGYVKSSESGENLIGANVYIKETLKGIATNSYGFYSLTLDKGQYTLVVSFIGFKEYSQPITLDGDLKINVSLEPSVITTSEVVITGEKQDNNTQSTQVGRFEMPVERIKKLPAFMGEIDVLKTIQLTPGVQSAGEGNSGYYVRGGGPDQNLILLDEAVVYNASHLLGFFSVFNADALKTVELTKAGMPANYGGRLASVLDISMKDGNMKQYHLNGGIGFISSRLTAEGPIVKDKCSFIVSGRRTYIDLFMKPFLNETSPLKHGGYYFYDLNAKVNYIFSDKDRVFLSGYFGRDVFAMKSTDLSFSNNIGWGNATASLRWNHLYNDKLFSNATFVYSDYGFNMEATQNLYEMKLNSGITDYNGKLDFTWMPSILQTIKFGANYVYHIMTPSNASAKSGDTDFNLGEAVELYSHEFALYANDEIDLTEWLRVNAGLRYTYFQHTGPFDRYLLNDVGKISDTVHYGKGEPIKSYNRVEPRLSVRFLMPDQSSIKLSYTQNYQYIHMASYASVSLPMDIWIPSSSIVEPQYGVQYSLGYFRNFKQNMFETSFELYYKHLKNQIEFKEGSSAGDNFQNNIDNNLTFGTGDSYGGELFLKKRTGKFTGWIGYTLSWTTRLFPEVNGGDRFPAKYDRRHDVSVVGSYDITDRLNISAVWVYATGNAMTLPLSRYFIGGNIVNQYSKRNEFRMPAYHRLDFSLTYMGKKKKRFQSSYNVSIYNVYSRMNPYYIYFETTGDLSKFDLTTTAKQVSLFPIIPSFTWNFTF